MASKRLALVGGGTGFVGRHLVKCFEGLKNTETRVITRNPKKYSKSEISWKDIERNGLPKGTFAVLNLAGRNILESPLWTESFKKECYDSRIGTNRTLVKAINEASEKPECFLKISGVGFYESRPDNYVYTEAWQRQKAPKGYLEKLAVEWEDAGKLDDALSCIRQITIRSGVVLGPDGGIISRLRWPFYFGLGGTLGNGLQPFPYIHVEDLVELFKFSLLDSKVNGIINGVAPQVVSHEKFIEALAKCTGSRRQLLPLSSTIVKFLFGPDRAEILLEGQVCTSRAQSLGFKFKYPSILEAVSACIK